MYVFYYNLWSNISQVILKILARCHSHAMTSIAEFYIYNSILANEKMIICRKFEQESSNFRGIQHGDHHTWCDSDSFSGWTILNQRQVRTSRTCCRLWCWEALPDRCIKLTDVFFANKLTSFSTLTMWQRVNAMGRSSKYTICRHKRRYARVKNSYNFFAWQ